MLHRLTAEWLYEVARVKNVEAGQGQTLETGRLFHVPRLT